MFLMSNKGYYFFPQVKYLKRRWKTNTNKLFCKLTHIDCVLLYIHSPLINASYYILSPFTCH